MQSEVFVLMILGWLSNNLPLVIEFIQALFPLAAFGVFGLAIMRLTNADKKRGRQK